MKSIKFLAFSIFTVIVSACSSESNENNEVDVKDTVAPVVNISFSGLPDSSGTDSVIVKEELRFTVGTQDAGGVAKVEVFLDNEKIAEDTTSPFEFVIDLAPYSAKTRKSYKEFILKVVATDNSGNATTEELPLNIPKKLITVNFPLDEQNPERSQLFVFASQMDGTLLAIEELQTNENSITLYSSVDVPDNLEYMITIAEKNNAYYGETNELSTIQNINLETLKEINLKARPRFTSNFFDRIEPLDFPIEGFLDETTTDFLFINGSGLDYSAQASCNCPFNTGNLLSDSLMIMNRYNNIGNGLVTDKVYLQFSNATTNTSESAMFDKTSLQPGFILSRDMFGADDMVLEQFEFPNLDLLNSKQPTILVYAYESAEEFENNNYYRLDPYNFFENDRTITKFWLNTSFANYITGINYLQYSITHVGAPYEQYLGKEWTLSHTFENNTFNLNKNTNEEDVVGSIFLSDDFYQDYGGSAMMLNGRDGTYRWNIKFDSQNATVVNLPEIPSEIQNWVFSSKYASEPIGTIEDSAQRNVELIKYEGIVTYEEYLQEIIKDNVKWYLVAPVKESVMDNPSSYDSPIDGFYFPFD